MPTHPCDHYLDRLFEQKGALSIDEYMDACLGHPDWGYYSWHDPLGTQGDFITAPEISQLFSEMIAIFIQYHIPMLMKQKPYILCELGAGRGTLLRDILKILRTHQPPKNVYILEQNQTLIEKQKAHIPDVVHIDRLKDLPDMPVFFLANEFFDALPMRFYQIDQEKEIEIKICKIKGEYCFSPAPRQNASYRMYSKISEEILSQIGKHISQQGGAGLICDYGYKEHIEDHFSFRGYYQHNVTSGLGHCGQQDLTANISFAFIEETLKHYQNITYPILTQKQFLENMHIHARYQQLKKHILDIKQQEAFEKGMHLLLSPDEMGEKFKFLFFSQEACEIYPFGGA